MTLNDILKSIFGTTANNNKDRNDHTCTSTCTASKTLTIKSHNRASTLSVTDSPSKTNNVDSTATVTSINYCHDHPHNTAASKLHSSKSHNEPSSVTTTKSHSKQHKFDNVNIRDRSVVTTNILFPFFPGYINVLRTYLFIKLSTKTLTMN
jgi:hypothetical protein